MNNEEQKYAVRIVGRGYIEYCEWWNETKQTEYGVIDDITFARLYTRASANLITKKLKKKGITTVKILVD